MPTEDQGGQMFRSFRYAPDGSAGGGSGATPEPPAGQPAGATPQAGDPSGSGATPTPLEFEAWLATQDAGVKAAYAAHVATLEGTLKSEREARKAAEREQAARKKAEEDAEKERLAAEGKFKELAEAADKRALAAEAKIAELEPVATQLERYKTALDGYVKAARAAVPAHVQTLLDRLDPVEQLDYLSKNADAFGTKPPGGPLNNPARGNGAELNDEERRRRSWAP
jgi:hypothetical protein